MFSYILYACEAFVGGEMSREEGSPRPKAEMNKPVVCLFVCFLSLMASFQMLHKTYIIFKLSNFQLIL